MIDLRERFQPGQQIRVCVPFWRQSCELRPGDVGIIKTVPGPCAISLISFVAKRQLWLAWACEIEPVEVRDAASMSPVRANDDAPREQAQGETPRVAVC